MHLSQLLIGIGLSVTADPIIKGLCQDSRQVKPGDLFFAYPGLDRDGRHFIPEAIAKGAAAILFESEGNSVERSSSSIPILPLHHLTAQLGPIAARFYDYPSRYLPVIGITGTNGKTSCTHFLADSLQQLQKPCGVIGTLGNGFYGDLKPGQLTTPDAIELQQLLANFRDKQAQAVVMEVSSHRLAQQRLNGTEFSVAAFTNLTRDHLDYHESMSAYAQAKRSIFDLPGVQQAILNADDPYAQLWLTELAEQLPVYTYSLHKPQAAWPHIPQITVKKFDFNEQGLRAEIDTPWGEVFIENRFLMGPFNLSNLLLVLTILKNLHFSLAEISQVISKLKGVKGRMQAFHVPGKALVVVDYAHTPDALQQVLRALRPHCAGELYCLFGCGGDRDKGKRPLMAEIAEQEADHIVLTNDNPRDEDPLQILQAIQKGFTGKKSVYREPDRQRAIAYTLATAQPTDVVLVAGKGHEAYQLINGIKYPFDDAIEVQRFLNQ
ncbi:UDP-N-acetylmuramoyl-L-alanyl-D-glutamate--2,6-diaminopimelate ligase [Rickettsiella endosymbiont of Litargus connexus]|jgi:UDP-N-acetylmuramoyl-L-alanyl-D-glutamate--2,6-diaminopimelate ligase|uniref:UDP-N-acetylmuramoyl-L-alanyl-D-glutamate--2, 6-diaminopimelate ligase n=1 Tax=Rickettsiella endosymbiont of Litargus connexus TaxID=3066237 RepID=UPI00376EE6A2